MIHLSLLSFYKLSACDKGELSGTNESRLNGVYVDYLNVADEQWRIETFV